MKKILKEIILGLFGRLAYIFFPILVLLKKQTIFVINYHATACTKVVVHIHTSAPTNGMVG